MISTTSQKSKALQGLQSVFEVNSKTLLVRKTRIVLGSVVSADVRIQGEKIAPLHAVIEMTYGANPDSSIGRIIDLASPGGVRVNGTKVVQSAIKSGDLIELGDSKIRFTVRAPVLDEMMPDQALLLIDEDSVTPIFDYRPLVKDTLEVVYSWNESILGVEHFTDQLEVSLGGTNEQDFLIPPVLSSGNNYTLARRNEGAVGTRSWTLNIDAKMGGVVYLNGELLDLDDVRKRHLNGLASGNLILKENDFAKLEAGAIQFYVSQTVAPPTLKKGATPLITDPFFVKTLCASFVISTLMLVGLSALDDQSPEVVQISEPIATILYHPEMYTKKQVKKPPPPEKKAEAKEEEKIKKAEVDFTKPKELEKKAQVKSASPGKKQLAQNRAKEGEGARAKGAEGSRGAKNAPKTDKPQNRAMRVSTDPGQGQGGTKSQAMDNGNVQMLKGATNKILDLLGGSGERLGKSGSKLQGFGGFTTQGNGGLAIAGAGKGGGGTADTLLGGLGNKGRGGGRVGTGLGADGTGQGIIGGKTRIELRSGGGDETIIVGSIDRDAIEAAIRAHRDEFLYCYDREVNSGNPNLSGKVLPRFVIGGSGRASQMVVASSSIGNANVERCVLAVIGRIQFPQPTGGVPVTVTYPFSFAAQK